MTLGDMADNVSGSTAASGTLNFNGGSLKVNNNITLANWDTYYGSYGSAAGTLNLNGGTATVGGSILNGGGTATVNVNAGATLSLGTFSDISVNTLLLNGTITNGGSITVSNLSGSGSIVNQGVMTTVNGTLSPGTGTTPGTLKLGRLTLGSIAGILPPWSSTSAIPPPSAAGSMTFWTLPGTLTLAMPT